MCRRHHNNRSSHRDRLGDSRSSHSSHRDRLGGSHSSHRDRLGDSRSSHSSHRDRPGGSRSSHNSHKDRLGDSRSSPLCREVAGRIPTVSKIGSMLMEQRLKEEAYLMRDLRERVVA